MSMTTDASRTLRVGVVGLGFAGTTHLDAFTALPGVEVIALAGQEPERLRELATSRGVPNAYADWQDLVARDDLDIVSIGVPNRLHHPIAVAALESGKHVFCEKPLATTGEQAQEMVDAALRNDRVLEVAYNHRRRADVQFLANHLRGGQTAGDAVDTTDDGALATPGTGPIGTVYHARASWLRRAGIPGIRSWFVNKETAGGGPLIDLGSHVLDIALHLMGEPTVVTASAVTYNELGRAGRGGSDRDPVSAATGRPFDVEDFASALLRFEDGSSLLLQASWASYSKDAEDIEVELLGSTGGARLFIRDYATEGTVTLYSDEQGIPTVTRPGVQVPAGHHQRVIEEFLATIRSGRHDGHHGEFALHRSRVVDAVYASAQAGHEVEVVR
ncbi:Gfo/Idh/MocA family oxidoreductase [Curtobacterium aetherium]|uniref:Gfo/Idh/MocA family protein n=1 Tax=Curtobacterium aetherium TaxID=2841594 RepID=UPI003B51A64B